MPAESMKAAEMGWRCSCNPFLIKLSDSNHHHLPHHHACNGANESDPAARGFSPTDLAVPCSVVAWKKMRRNIFFAVWLHLLFGGSLFKDAKFPLTAPGK